MTLRLALLALLLWVPRSALAEEDSSGDGWATSRSAMRRPPDISPDFASVGPETRFHLTTRLTPTQRDLLWSVVPQAALRLSSYVALNAALPFGFNLGQGTSALGDQIFLGNVRVGVEGGATIWSGPGSLRPEFRVGGSIDIYAPTSPLPGAGSLDPVAILQRTLLLEPGLFMSRSMAFRARLHLGVDLSIVGLDAEFGGTPAFTIEDNVHGYGWLTLALRARVLPTTWLEPFVELGGTLAIGQPSLVVFSPGGFVFTPGVRFHIGGLSPAVFAHIFGGPSGRPDVVSIGVDLAGVVMPTRKIADEAF